MALEQYLRKSVADQRGAAIVLVAASMLALVSAAALAIDIGLLLTARVESQRAADSAALAGAGWLIIDPDDSIGAVNKAIEYAALNNIRGTAARLESGDVQVILDSAKVRVFVQNLGDRDNAITTFFARVFGIGSMDIRTMATAWAAPVIGTNENESECLLPIALPDRYIDLNGDGQYDPGETYDPQSTGLGDWQIGQLVAVKVSGSQNTGGPQACRQESDLVDLDLCRELPDSENWRCWWREAPDADGGAEVLGGRIYPGTGCSEEMEVGDQIWTASASGGKQSLTNTVHEDFGGTCTTVCYDYNGDGIADEGCEQQCPNGSFGDLIRADPDLYWDGSEAFKCVRRVGESGCFEGDSPRIRRVPVIRPDLVSGTGAGVTSYVSEFAGVFIEKVACNYDLNQFEKSGGNLNVYIRIIRNDDPGGKVGGDPGPGAGGTTLKRLQLIE